MHQRQGCRADAVVRLRGASKDDLLASLMAECGGVVLTVQCIIMKPDESGQTVVSWVLPNRTAYIWTRRQAALHRMWCMTLIKPRANQDVH